MDLLNRYLQAVKVFLPHRDQDDILRELSENLVAQMEDRAETLGRPLTDAEQAEILRRHGHPMVVAGRYRARQYLVGPVFFPIYLFALKVGLGVALIVTIALAAAGVALDGDPVRQAVQAMLAYPGRALMVFAWTTLVFAGLDLAQQHLGVRPDWDPRSLPPVARSEYPVSRIRAICDLTFAAAGLVWLLLLPSAPYLILGPAAAFAEPGAPLRLAYLPLVGLAAAMVALHATYVSRPYWTKARAVARLGIHAGYLLLFGFLLAANDSFVIAARAAASDNAARVGELVNIINISFQIGFLFVVVLTVFEAVRELQRIRSRSASSSTSAPARA
jgi:hypothetical protein